MIRVKGLTVEEYVARQLSIIERHRAGESAAKIARDVGLGINAIYTTIQRRARWTDEKFVGELREYAETHPPR